MRSEIISVLGTLALGAAHLAASAATSGVPAPALPQSTAIPVRFDRSIDAKKARAGDVVTAKTMQQVLLPGGRVIARGSILTGHVVSVGAFSFDPAPYAHQRPSLLSIHFDTLRDGDSSVPLSTSVRAIAATIDSRDAASPRSNVDGDPIGEFTLIGGMTYSPLDTAILGEDGDAIAYNRKGGVVAHLIASGSCNGTDTEQAIAIFSPNACGAYGFGGAYLAESGRDGSGTFTLGLRGHSVKLYAGSTALLQVNEAK